MSFFDEGGEPETIRAPRPRRAGSGVRGSHIDDQTLLVRRAIAAGVGLVLVILIVVGIKGCLDSQRNSAMRSYNTNVSQLITESDQQVAAPLFAALQSAQGQSPLDVEVKIDQYRVTADSEAQRARNLNVPSQMAGAQQAFLTVMDFRAEAVKRIADSVRSALSGQAVGAGQAVATISGEMEALLASDVIYAKRVAPLISQALADRGIHGQVTATTQFIPDLGWLSPQTVAQRILGHGIGSGGSGAVRPGVHGHALLSVSTGGTTLTPGTTVNTIKLATGLTFDLKVQNQGTNNEFGVGTSISIQGSGSPITLSKTIDQTTAGATTDVLIPLTQTPPTGTPLRLVANVAPVPGEKVLSNNTLTYLVVFSH